jgi:1,2-diacylglycerol 3-beta-glucosyltransferase
MSPHAMLFLFTASVAGLALAGTSYVVSLAVVGMAWKPRKESAVVLEPPTTRFLILIPAHDEEQGIGPTLESLRLQNYPESLRRVIVIADNCNDRTAALVREMGFECWERTEPSARGKGQALRWALDQLASGSSTDAIAFIDADSRVHPEFLAAMDVEIRGGAAAVQGRYEFEVSDSSYFSLLTFASKRAENVLFWRPRERFGCMGFIVGNGFCVSRKILERVPWEAYSIVEDVEYALQLALRGIRVRFVESAQVVSRGTRRTSDAAPQRLRWASGTFQVMIKYVPQLLRSGTRRGSYRLLEMALALTLTSRFFLVYLVLAASAGSLLLGTAGSGYSLRIMVFASILLLSAYVAMVLAQIPSVRGGRVRALVMLPFYLCWMLLVQVAAALGRRRSVWVRTTR